MAGKCFDPRPMIDFIYDFRLLPLGNGEVSQSIRMWLCGVLPVYPLQRAIAIIIIAEALIINYAFAATRPEGNSWPFITVATRRTCSTLIVRPADTDEAAEPCVPRFGWVGIAFPFGRATLSLPPRWKPTGRLKSKINRARNDGKRESRQRSSWGASREQRRWSRRMGG